MSILTRYNPLVRHSVADPVKAAVSVNDVKAAEMCRTLFCENDIELVRDAMIRRYAQVIVPEVDEVSGAETASIYRANSRLKLDWAAQQAILAGQQETVRLYLYNSIVRARATLFSEPTAHYEYEGETTEEIIEDVRDDGNANLSAIRWDTMADGIGSCALYIANAGGVMQYSPIPPHRIWIVFSPTIHDGEMERATNTERIDEATTVVIELAGDGESRRFCAWYGPSDVYPDGRQVQYAGKAWDEIPEVGADAALDYSISAGGFVRGARDVGNPLSLIAQSQGANGAPVYPIVILYGTTLSMGILPMSSSLYDVCCEVDLMGSMILGAAGKGARGAKALQRGTDPNIPDSVDEAMVLLGREQELTNVGWPASHAADAMKVLDGFARHIAEAHQVPGFMVVADQAGEIPSGVALELMMLPLRRNRDARVELNRRSVARRFEIERLIINGDQGTATIPYDERETWIAGQPKMPRDPLIDLQTWEKKISMRAGDLADMVQDMYSFSTREQSIGWLESHAEDAKTIEVLKPTAPPQITTKPGLAERLGVIRGGKKDNEAEKPEKAAAE